ncbi:MAG: class I SAM-dependent methyltransferase [Acidobacteriota bacterium]
MQDSRRRNYEEFLAVTHEFERDYWWFHGLRAYTEAFLDRLPARGNLVVLDAGCGPGGNYPLVSRYGKVFAFDFMFPVLRFARTYGVVRSACASITHIPFADSRFDLAFSFDVLTAIEPREQQGALSELFRVLKPGAHLFLNLAALSILWGKQDVAGNIKVRYSRGLLLRQLSYAGFEVLRSSYAFAFSFPAMLAVRLVDRYVLRSLESAGPEGDFFRLPGPINKALTLAARVEARLLRHISLPIGSSVMALARKPAGAARD